MMKTHDPIRILFCFLFCFLLGNTVFGAEGRFEKEIADYVKRNVQTPPPANCTMFIGSSTWRLWGDQLEKDFDRLKAVNRGFGGSTIPEVSDAADRLIIPYKPARILFFCGTNDIAGKADPNVVYENFLKFLTKVWKNDPLCEVYYVSTTHAPVRKAFWENCDKLNAKVKKLADETQGLYYIDLITPMNDEKGITREDLFIKDRLHLNRAAQEMWVPIILKAVEEGKEKEEVIAHPDTVKQQRMQAGILLEPSSN